MKDKKIIFSLIGIMMFLSLGLNGITASAIPENFPQQAIDNAKIFQPRFFQNGNLTAVMLPMVTTYTYPLDHETSDPTQAKLIFQRTDTTAGCSGNLLDRTHILTAAHCMSDEFGNLVIDNTATSKAYFYSQNGGQEFSYDIVEYNVHPSYDGKGEKGYDIAIITLGAEVDPIFEVKQIDRNGSDDINNFITTRSFGVGGYGSSGNNPSSYPFGIERQALTQIDALGDVMYEGLGMTPVVDYQPGFVLQTDFDNGGTNTDAFNYFFGIPQLGTGTDEDGSTCFGDSGGALYNQAGEITGVNSYIISLSLFNTLTTDVTPELDCSFGEFTGHTRVSSHTDWIDSIISPVSPPSENPITCGPGTILDSNNQCVPDNPVICGNNTTLNIETSTCELDAETTQILADVQTLLSTNNCSPMATTIPEVLVCIDDLIASQSSPTNLAIDTTQNQLQMSKGSVEYFTIYGSGLESGLSITFEGGPKAPSATVTTFSPGGLSMEIEVTSSISGPNKAYTYDLRVTMGTDSVVWTEALVVTP